MKLCLGITEEQCSLMNAIESGKLIEVKKVVKGGVSPNFTTEDSIACCPLSLAAHKGSFDIVKWLVEEGGCVFDEDLVSFIASSGQIGITTYLAKKLFKG